MRMYFNTSLDLVIGGALIFLALEATRREMGLFLPIFILCIVIYPFIGHLLPEPFYCHSLGIKKTISKLSIGLESGIFQYLSISTNYIFLFAVFGGLLQAVGGTEFFIRISRILAERIQGGPGMMAVLSSAMVGSITGSGAANVMITGVFTIPLMKKTGFRPEQAGAIEAAASNGGQIMPPIMGMVAFAMAGLTGIPYIKICAMAVVPAILYYFTCGTYVYLNAKKLNIGRELDMNEKERPDMKSMFLSSLTFVVPFTLIVALLIKGYSVMLVAFWAIVGVILIGIINRKSPKEIIYGITAGVKAGSGIAASVAAVGLLATTFITSGLGVKIASGIEVWSRGNLFMALLIIWVVCIVLGCVGLAITAYIVAALFGVAPLVKMGVPFEIAHFFVMYASVFAFLTPPIAVVALIAARVAGATYLETAKEATKIALAAFLLPFLFIYSPVLLLKPKNLADILEIPIIIVGLVVLESGLVGYLFRKYNLLERVISITTMILLCLFLTTKVEAFLIFGGLFMGALLFLNRPKVLNE